MTTHSPVQSVILYARVSHTDTDSSRSVTDQLAELRAWAQREDWEVVREYAEQGSASRFASRERPEWREVMAAVGRREADALLTWEASRATRDLGDFAALRDACASAGMSWGYSGTLHDLTDRSARFRTGLEALLAEDEAAKIRERVVRGVRAAAERGAPHGRQLYGYRREYEGEGDARRVVAVVPDPVRAPIVREATRRVLAGESLNAVARALNTAEAPTAATDSEEGGRLWTASKVRQMLRRPGYAGLRTYRGEVVGEAAWEPLIAREDWEELQALFEAARTAQGPQDHRAAYLLTGIARCGVCGSKLVRRKTRSGKVVRKDGTVAEPRRYDTYACAAGIDRTGGGFHVSMSQQHLDDYVSRLVVARLAQPDVLEALAGAEGAQSDERAALRAEIAGYREHLEAARAFAAEHLRMDLLVDQEARLKPRIDAAERRLRELAGVHPEVRRLAEATDVQAAWDALDLEGQRHVVRVLLVPSVLPRTRPGRRGLDPERVSVNWVSGAGDCLR
ncbi:recombinase family protein [Micrococcus luteus]|nr:recombinase family protein [Micrococcus luteus]